MEKHEKFSCTGNVIFNPLTALHVRNDLNECLFSGFMGNESECVTFGDLFVLRSNSFDISHEPRKKDTYFLYNVF